MAVFEIQGPDGKIYEVEAPDEQSAVRAFQDFSTDDGKYAMPGSTADGYFVQGMSGANEGLANTLGAPVDAANWVIGKGMDGINAIAGTDLQPSQRPFLGSDMLKGWMSDAGSIAPQSRDPNKQFARRVGQEVGAVAVPVGGTIAAGTRMLARGGQLASQVGGFSQAVRSAAQNPGRFMAAETGLATGSGIGAATAQQMAPDSALAELFGQFVGGMSPLGVTAMTRPTRAASAARNQNPRLTAEDLERMANKAYDRADNAGVIFKPEMMQRMRQGIQDDLADFGYHPQNHPGAKVALDELDRIANGNATLKGLDTTRKIARGGRTPTNPENNLAVGRIISNIDNTVDNVGRNDILMGDADGGIKALKEGRELWARKRKLDVANSLLERAELNAASSGSGGNIENATRAQLKRALTNPEMKRSFNEGEQGLLRKAVVGSKGQDLLRLGGKLSPGGNGLMTYLMGAGAAMEPTIGIPAMVAGYGSRKAAEALSKRNIDILIDAIASGKTAPKVPKRLTPVEQSALQTLLISQIVGNNRPVPAPAL